MVMQLIKAASKKFMRFAGSVLAPAFNVIYCFLAPLAAQGLELHEDNSVLILWPLQSYTIYAFGVLCNTMMTFSSV